MRSGAALLAVLLLAGCTADPEEQQTRVVVAGHAFAWLAERVGGEGVEVVDASRGGDPHAVRADVRVRDGDLVLAPPGVLDGGDRLDLGPLPAAASDLGDEEGGVDPHVWLDPVRLAEVAEELGRRLPGSRDRAAGTAADLRAVDARYRDGLAGCARRELVTSHTAFGHLAARYDLRHVGVAGTSPDDRPSAGRLAEVERFAREAGVTTVLVDPAGDPDAAALAGRLGVPTTPLSALEGGDGDVLAELDEDLAVLRAALGCG